MQAIILAAGMGRRLGAASQGLPKCLLRIGGRSILHRQIEALHHLDVREIVVVTGYRAEAIQEAVRTIPARLVHNPRYAQTNVLASWALGSALLGDDHFYLHGDTVFEAEILQRALTGTEAGICLTVDRHACGDEEMKVAVRDRRVLSVNKDMSPDFAAGEFTGVMFVRREMLSPLRRIADRLLAQPQGDRLFFEAVLEELVRERPHEVGWVDVSGLRWQEIDFEEDRVRAERLFPT